MEKKYKVIKLLKVQKPFSNKVIIRKQNAYPYGIEHLGHAKACARMVNAEINYSDENNNVVNVVVQDLYGNIVFVARMNIDGIYGNELGDIEE